MKGAIRQVLESKLDDYVAPKKWNIAGVTIHYKPDPSGVSSGKWRETLEEWLPRFRDADWTEDLIHIQIGKDIVTGGAVGQYNSEGTIYLENDISDGLIDGMTVGNSQSAVLTHEFIHHAHLTLNGCKGSNKKSNYEGKFKEDVSYYAGKNIGEAIAETGTAIVQGKDIPDWAHKYYAEKDGPQEVYDL